MSRLRIYERPSFPVFEDFFGDFYRPFSEKISNFHTPANISETKEHYLVSVEAPGFEKGELEIDYADGILNVSGEKEVNEKSKDDNYRLLERRLNNFKRSFRIADVNASKVEASYDSGILNIILPKKEAAKPKKISIGEGKNFGDKIETRNQKVNP